MSDINTNKNGQLPIGFNLANNEIKAINTLYGIIMGITADGKVTDEEIHFLNLWILDNENYTNSFPLNVIKQRITDILTDHAITHEERETLYHALGTIVGGTYQETGAAGGLSTDYGTEQPDSIIIQGSTFCLTGEFFTGTRSKCEQIITALGGTAAKSVTKKLDYLVIGAAGSEDWIAAGHGRKIEKAMHYQNKGCPVTIINEETWAKYIPMNL